MSLNPPVGMGRWMRDREKAETLASRRTQRRIGPYDDTDWITPTLNAGWTPEVGAPPQYRRLNGVVYHIGRASTVGTNAAAYAVPAGFRPLTLVIASADAGASNVRMSAQNTGAVGQVAAATSSGNMISFAALSGYIADL